MCDWRIVDLYRLPNAGHFQKFCIAKMVSAIFRCRFCFQFHFKRIVNRERSIESNKYLSIMPTHPPPSVSFQCCYCWMLLLRVVHDHDRYREPILIRCATEYSTPTSTHAPSNMPSDSLSYTRWSNSAVASGQKGNTMEQKTSANYWPSAVIGVNDHHLNNVKNLFRLLLASFLHLHFVINNWID